MIAALQQGVSRAPLLPTSIRLRDVKQVGCCSWDAGEELTGRDKRHQTGSNSVQYPF